MAVERRNGNGRYVYRSVRAGGRVVKQYLGSATEPVTSTLLGSQRLAIASEEAAAQEVAEEMAAYAKIEPLLRLVARQLRRLLLRHRQALQTHKAFGMKTKPATLDENDIEMGVTRDEFDDLAERAAEGDRESVESLLRYLRRNPAVYRCLGDVSRHAQKKLASLLTRDDPVASGALSLKIDQMRRELGAEWSGPLERLLVEQSVTTWLEVNFLQLSLGQCHDNKSESKHWEGRLSSAQKRHIAALKALAEVRGCGVPKP